MSAERTVIGGRYELNGLPLGQGGMGQVFPGYDRRLDRKVAVKLIRFPFGQYDEDLVRRFCHETKIMAKLAHPGTPAIYDADVHDDRPFMVMQFVEGITVDDLLAEQGPLPIGWAAAIAAQVVAVLHAAHGRGIFHRDLKPSNLMVCPDGAVKVLDFGLAMFHDPELSRITRSGTILGSPAYMSPEQIRAATVGPQSDFYSLGVVLHELLTGRRLFDGPTDFAIFERHISEQPPSARDLRSEVPEELDALVLRMLSKRAEDRPADAVALHTALMRHATDLPPLPGVVHPAPSALHMYAETLTQVSQSRDGARLAPPRQATPPPREFDRDDIARARTHAEDLAKSSRYGQAVEVLETALEPARRALGALDSDVLDLRMYLAEVLFEGGNYRRAVPAFGELHRDLAARYGPRDARVLCCRRQEATCRALLGDTGRALAQLRELLAEEEAIYGRCEPPVLELRRQIGLLELGAGDTDRAARTLSGLLDDLTDHYGSDHPETRRVRDSLARLSL